MFYDKFFELCKAKNVSRTKACVDCGVSRTAWHKWKDGAIPNGATINKFAEYFDISVGFLLGAETKPATDKGDEPLEDCIVVHRNGKTSTYKFTQEQLDLMAAMIKQFGEEEIDL